MGPRSIPEHHGKRQNFKAAAWRLTLDTRCGYALNFGLLEGNFNTIPQVSVMFFFNEKLWNIHSEKTIHIIYIGHYNCYLYDKMALRY